MFACHGKCRLLHPIGPDAGGSDTRHAIGVPIKKMEPKCTMQIHRDAGVHFTRRDIRTNGQGWCVCC
jgi:hypothetical protein